MCVYIYIDSHILRQNLYVKLVCQATELGLYLIVNGEPLKDLKEDLSLRKIQRDQL